MRANMRWVSSTDETFFVRMASAASNAVAKSRSWTAAAPEALLCDAGIEQFCAPALLFAGASSAKISETGRVEAARASGTVARKSRRFICEMVKGGEGRRNLVIGKAKPYR